MSEELHPLVLSSYDVTAFAHIKDPHYRKGVILPKHFDPARHRIIMENKPVTRKYEEEYQLYLNYVASLGGHFKPLTYSLWEEQWNAETEQGRADDILRYHRLIALSSQERLDAFAFTLDVTARS